MADADDYLQEGFDPRSVTVPRLRSILVTHNVEYPATAKKPQLVELVENHVLPQVAKLRAQRAKAKRSSSGIVNAGSPEDNGRWEDYGLEHQPTPVRPRRSASPRKASARIKKEDDDGAATTPTPYKSQTKRGARSASRSSRQPSHYDEDEAPRSTRRSRSRRSATPKIKNEPEAEEETPVTSHYAPTPYSAATQYATAHNTPYGAAAATPFGATPYYPAHQSPPTPSAAPYEEEESVFTDDNPFQSGSPALKTPSRRRFGDDFARSEKPSRRREEYIEPLSIPRPSTAARPSYELSARKPRHESPDYSVDAGEEFTPDAQLELEEAARRGETTIVPRRQKQPRQTNLKTPFFVLFMSLLGVYLAWYRQEKIAVGYCGLGRPATQIIPPELPVPDVLVPLVEPQCEPCPAHAYCYEDFSVRCHNGFVLKPHPLSFGGLVPLPPTCEPDGEKARRVQAVADKAIEELRQRRAKYECGEPLDESGTTVDSPAIAEEELKSSVSRKRNKRLNSDEFEDLWVAAIGEITSRDEVVVEMATSPGSPDIPNRKLSSSSLARLPLGCALKRSVRLGLARHRLPIGLLMSVVLAVLYLRARYRQHLTDSAQVPALVDLVLERLANQKELGEEDLDDPWLFLPNLRDDVLRSVHKVAERERIWQRVKKVVEQNSNVRTGQREGRSGEVGRAWEWIGPIHGGGTRRRRASGRWARDQILDTPESTMPAAAAESKKWTESRPIF
ncbi:Inner nuclear membrane protein SRC1 [Trichoderma ghanense]|uniref:Inner nuclear membrane protein SRC1 n=1 Tax=Trichoderma ghanense TaxID=65468 RepID=A0ABY2HEA1_9HYPO